MEEEEGCAIEDPVLQAGLAGTGKRGALDTLIFTSQMSPVKNFPSNAWPRPQTPRVHFPHTIPSPVLSSSADSTCTEYNGMFYGCHSNTIPNGWQGNLVQQHTKAEHTFKESQSQVTVFAD